MKSRAPSGGEDMKPGIDARKAQLEPLSRAAGACLRAFFGRDLQIRHKGEVDLVTEADEAAERLLVTKIETDFPGDGVLTEEGRNRRTDDPFRWIIDPLDGTTNFAHGLPHFATSIALEAAGEVVAGAIYDPIKDEFFSAEKGAGAFLNGRPIHLVQRSSLETCLCVSGFPYDRRRRLPELLGRVERALAHGQGFRRLGAASLDLAYIACGRLDVYWEDALHPWDVAAGVLLVREAGGVVTNLRGGTFELDSGEILATHPKLCDAVVAHILEK